LNKIINKLKNLSPDSSELLKKGGSAFIIRLLGFASGYIFLLMVTNWYGAEANGILSLSITFIMLLTILSRAGMDTSLVKYTAKNNVENTFSAIGVLYKKSIQTTFLISFLLSIILYIYSNYISDVFFESKKLGHALKIICIAIPTWTLVQINSAILRGFKLTNWYSFYFQLGRFLLATVVILIIWTLFKTGNIYVPIWAYTIGCVIMAISSTIHLKILLSKKIKNSNQSDKSISFGLFIKESLPMMLSASLMFLMGWLSTLILGVYESTKIVGIFNVAIKVSTLTTFVLTAVNSIAAPKFSELFYGEKLERFEKVVKNSTRLIFVTTLPIILVLSIFPEFILSFFGKEFLMAKNTLLILLIGQLINSFSGSVGYILQMTGYERIFQNILFFGLLLNIVLCFILIPKYGIVGAALATSISMGIWNLISVYHVKKKLNILTIRFW